MKAAGVSLFLGFVASAGSLVLGTTIGLISGFFGGRVDDFIQRVAELDLAFPNLVLFIAVIAVFGTGFWLLVLLLAIGGWVGYCKIARGQVLSAKQKEYVEAAKVIGAGNVRLMRTHILPNVASPLIVIWTFSVATIIIVESGLSFLGLGIQPPQPAWGSMLSDGRELIATSWWLATMPGVAIMITVMAVNIFGDALRDMLDPRLR
jgi:peptide/nickel transport system permease protein